MEIIASIIQFIPNLCTQISHQSEYVRHLKNNVDALMEEARNLKALCEDTQSEGREAARGRKRLTERAQTWLKEARTILAEVNSIKLQFDQRRTFCNGCFPDLWSDYKLGKIALKKLERVRRNLNERSGIQLLMMSSPPRVIEMDVPTVGHSSSQRNMDKIWDLLHDKDTSVICIYGMGGIGKTALMKAINNKLQAAGEFDCVIWVNMSKKLNVERVQEEIMGRLQLNFSEHDSYTNRSMQLRRYLTDKRYMLILDDLWNSINLSEIGIPIKKENGSKIAITTRIANRVSRDLKAEKIRIETLTKEEAWDLFAATVGKEVVHQPHINDVAKDVAMECGGLPLAIEVVAKAMQGQNKKELWQDALRALRASAPEIEGMEREVFPRLKRSYDDLKDEKVKKCFLCCSLFPEDYEIPVKCLIELLIMEGFIDNVNELLDASNKGHRIIEELKCSCLLEEGIRTKNSTVKMHDIIRDLALYITSPSCNEGPKFLVKAGIGEGLNEPPPVETWREFERISLMRNGITELPIKPECPKLVSLFLNSNPITAVPRSFFELMPALQVLDLSFTSIRSLSVSSSSLLNLRALILRECRTLTEVPFLGQLKELQFLDIKSSGIRSLPKEMQNLVKLKKLNVSELRDSFTIPSNVMSGLSSLEDLRMRRTNVNWANWAEGSEFAIENDVTLGEVGKLKRLTILKITIKDFDCVEDDVFLQYLPKLKKLKVEIGLYNYLKITDCMKQVHIYGGSNYSRGVQVMVTHTEGLGLKGADVKDVSQLVGVANALRMLDIRGCAEMKCILDWSDVGENALQNIEKLHLSSLSRLQKLFIGKVPQRCLRKLNEIDLSYCPNLKSLFSFEMVQNLDQLQTLDVSYCHGLEEIIEGHGLEEIIEGHDKPLPENQNLDQLQTLDVSYCHGLEEIIEGHGLEEIIEGHDKPLPENPFPRLRKFALEELPKLKSIIRSDTLALPSLIRLEIYKCPDLRLPKPSDGKDWPISLPERMQRGRGLTPIQMSRG